jgi:hypothetical protein
MHSIVCSAVSEKSKKEPSFPQKTCNHVRARGHLHKKEKNSAVFTAVKLMEKAEEARQLFWPSLDR